MYHAGNTFVMDEDLGCARVKLQFGDDQKKLEVCGNGTKRRIARPAPTISLL